VVGRHLLDRLVPSARRFDHIEERTVGDTVRDKASGLTQVNLGFPCTTSLSLIAIGPLTCGWTGVAFRPPRHACLDADAVMPGAQWARLWKRMPKEA